MVSTSTSPFLLWQETQDVDFDALGGVLEEQGYELLGQAKQDQEYGGFKEFGLLFFFGGGGMFQGFFDIFWMFCCFGGECLGFLLFKCFQ